MVNDAISPFVKIQLAFVVVLLLILKGNVGTQLAKDMLEQASRISVMNFVP